MKAFIELNANSTAENFLTKKGRACYVTCLWEFQSKRNNWNNWNSGYWKDECFQKLFYIQETRSQTVITSCFLEQNNWWLLSQNIVKWWSWLVSFFGTSFSCLLLCSLFLFFSHHGCIPRHIKNNQSVPKKENSRHGGKTLPSNSSCYIGLHF